MLSLCLYSCVRCLNSKRASGASTNSELPNPQVGNSEFSTNQLISSILNMFALSQVCVQKKAIISKATLAH